MGDDTHLPLDESSAGVVIIIMHNKKDSTKLFSLCGVRTISVFKTCDVDIEIMFVKNV